MCPWLTRTEFLDVQDLEKGHASLLNRFSDDPARIVRLTLRRLGRAPRAVPWMTGLTAWLVRFTPRNLVMFLSRLSILQTTARGKYRVR